MTIAVGDRVSVPNYMDGTAISGTVERIRPDHHYHKSTRTIEVRVDPEYVDGRYTDPLRWWTPDEVTPL